MNKAFEHRKKAEYERRKCCMDNRNVSYISESKIPDEFILLHEFEEKIKSVESQDPIELVKIMVTSQLSYQNEFLAIINCFSKQFMYKNKHYLKILDGYFEKIGRDIECFHFNKHLKALYYLENGKIMYFNDIYKSYYINEYYTESEFMENDYKLFKDFLRYGCEHDSVMYVIMNDDIQTFINKYVNEDFDTKIRSFSLIDEFKENRYVRLISAAAYFNSIKIFKFLIQKNAKVTKQTLKFALIGGNVEILQILVSCDESYFKKFGEYIKYSLKSHNNNIIDWIIDNTESVGFLISDAVDVYNVMCTFYCIQNECDINTIADKIPLTCACMNGSVMFAKLFLELGADFYSISVCFFVMEYIIILLGKHYASPCMCYYE